MHQYHFIYILQEPPQTISADLMTKFLLNNYSTVVHEYRNDKGVTGDYDNFWTKPAINSQLENTTSDDQIVSLSGYGGSSTVIRKTIRLENYQISTNIFRFTVYTFRLIQILNLYLYLFSKRIVCN